MLGNRETEPTVVGDSRNECALSTQVDFQHGAQQTMERAPPPAQKSSPDQLSRAAYGVTCSLC
jgi:hypothetical protein